MFSFHKNASLLNARSREPSSPTCPPFPFYRHFNRNIFLAPLSGGILLSAGLANACPRPKERRGLKEGTAVQLGYRYFLHLMTASVITMGSIWCGVRVYICIITSRVKIINYGSRYPLCLAMVVYSGRELDTYLLWLDSVFEGYFKLNLRLLFLRIMPVYDLKSYLYLYPLNY